MSFITRERNQPVLIIFALALLMIITLALRLIPLLFIQNQGVYYSIDPDTWYNLRQIEVMVAHFPQYNWFDSLTAYPFGKTIDWGPLYPFLAAALCRVLGASSRPDIMYLAGWVSPIMAALMVPVTYKLGKLIGDWKVGLVSAGLISVLSYQYFIASAYGMIDHHISELFFTTLFFLVYVYALIVLRRDSIDLNNMRTLITPVLLSVLSGILYFLGYLTSPTVLLALLVIGIYTPIQSIIDYSTGTRTEYLLFLNCLSFTSIAILVICFGFHQDGLSLITYSVGPVYVMLGLIAETVVLYSLSRLFSKNRVYYFLSLAAILIGGYLLVQILPIFKTISDHAVSLIWNSYSEYSFSVLETQPWTISAAYDAFNVALLLMAGGLVILIWHSVKKRQNTPVFLLTWFAVMLLLTLPHQRFQLFLTVPAALLSGICITVSIQWSWEAVKGPVSSWFSRFSAHSGSTGTQEPLGKKDRKARKTPHVSGTRIQPTIALKGIVLICIFSLTILVVVLSVGNDIAYVANTPDNQISPDWIGTLDWLKTSTPSPGVDYFQEYNQQTFTYPNESYGIMAPWTAGHQITFLSKRLPITNPFQNNLAGSDGAAAFYLSPNEESADKILSGFNGKYVITDLRIATDTFPALVPWVGSSGDNPPYLIWFFVKDPSNPSGLTKTHVLNDSYFQTTLVRLQMFDGSLVLPTTADYTQYVIQQVPDSGETAYQNGQARVILNRQTINASDTAGLVLIPEEKNLVTGKKYAGVFSSIPYKPVQKVPALTHYRLVHESQNNISVILGSGYNTLPDIKSVKVFEYVKGAHIPGEGIIELTVITNTGRTFIYQQESAGGEFIVPYATEEKMYDVNAAGPYHIVGTTRYISVTNDDVLNGRTITGSGG